MKPATCFHTQLSMARYRKCLIFDTIEPADLDELVHHEEQNVSVETQAAPMHDNVYGEDAEVGVVVKSGRAKSGGRIQLQMESMATPVTDMMVDVESDQPEMMLGTTEIMLADSTLDSMVYTPIFIKFLSLRLIVHEYLGLYCHSL